MTYYVIFGLLIPFKFGSGLTDVAFSVIGYPPIVVFIASFLIFTGFEFLNLTNEMNHLDWKLVRSHVSYMRLNAMVRLAALLKSHGAIFASTLILAGSVMITQGLIPFFLYDLPFQRKMDVNELVLDYNSKKRSVKRYKTGGESNVIPYRDLSAAYTIMLQLCKPELRDFHRSR